MKSWSPEGYLNITNYSLNTLTRILLFAEPVPASAPHGSLFQTPGEPTHGYVIVGGGTAGLQGLVA
jgi:hypothetical protein